MKKLEGKKVAILATDGYEQSELFSPLEALKYEGAEVHIISDKEDNIRAWDNGDWGKSAEVDKTINQASADDYNSLVLPGGVMNPDTLRTNRDAIKFIRDFFNQGKPVAAICHAPQLLISANVVEGRKMTSYKSIQQDLENAGAQWVNEEVVVDQGLVTSRNPGDLDAFNKKVIEETREGVHEEQMQSV